MKYAEVCCAIPDWWTTERIDEALDGLCQEAEARGFGAVFGTAGLRGPLELEPHDDES